MNAGVRLAVPRAAKQALERIAERQGVSMAAILRMGLVTALADAMPGLVEFAENPSQSPTARLRAAEVLRDVAEADMFLLPIGVRRSLVPARPALSVVEPARMWCSPPAQTPRVASATSKPAIPDLTDPIGLE